MSQNNSMRIWQRKDIFPLALTCIYAIIIVFGTIIVLATGFDVTNLWHRFFVVASIVGTTIPVVMTLYYVIKFTLTKLMNFYHWILNL